MPKKKRQHIAKKRRPNPAFDRKNRDGVTVFLDAAANLAQTLLDSYTLRRPPLESLDYSIGAQFRPKPPAAPPPAGPRIDAPGVITLQKDPSTGEWK
jgi:hypothetical protein